MNRFPFITVLFKAIVTLLLWILNKVVVIVHLCMPLGVFLLLMQLREKNNKTSALSTFTNDNSEFQFVFPDYILIANNPNSLKVGFSKKVTRLNNFLDKWKWIILVLMVGAGLGLISWKVLVG